MSPEHLKGNEASWDAVAADVEEYADTAHWTPWKELVRKFLRAGVEAHLHRYFRAGQSMHHVVFSTLDHHGLRLEPRVTVEFHPPAELRIAYGTGNLSFHTPESEYLLPFDAGFATFHRLLHELWLATVPEPIPEEILP
ncbi:MAG TPA: hypothetical protein VGM54_05465 [Chthoniobacter sp.]|jgi:hypothetical protein